MFDNYKKTLYIKLLQKGDIGADEFDKFFYCFNITELDELNNWFLSSLLEEIADNKIGYRKALLLLNRFSTEVPG